MLLGEIQGNVDPDERIFIRVGLLGSFSSLDVDDQTAVLAAFVHVVLEFDANAVLARFR